MIEQHDGVVWCNKPEILRRPFVLPFQVYLIKNVFQSTISGKNNRFDFCVCFVQLTPSVENFVTKLKSYQIILLA